MSLQVLGNYSMRHERIEDPDLYMMRGNDRGISDYMSESQLYSVEIFLSIDVAKLPCQPLEPFRMICSKGRHSL